MKTRTYIAPLRLALDPRKDNLHLVQSIEWAVDNNNFQI